MTERPSSSERRHTPRVGVRGNAIVHAATRVLRCDMCNLSMGGALLRSNDGDLVGLESGVPVFVELHLDAKRSKWIHVRGTVQRVGDAGEFSVSFYDITPQFEDIVEDEVLAGLEGEDRPRALVVELGIPRREHVAAALRTAGCRVIEVATPLEAIAIIEQSRAHVAVVLVGEQAATALQDYVSDQHPEIQVATIASRPRGAPDRAGWLFADQPDLGHQIRRLVGRHSPPEWSRLGDGTRE